MFKFDLHAALLGVVSEERTEPPTPHSRQGAGRAREAQALHRTCWTPSPGSGRSCWTAAWDSRLPERRAPQLCPSSSKGLGAQPGPGNLDISDLLAVQGAGGHGPVRPRAQRGRCSLPAHVHLTYVLLLIVTLAEGLLWDKRVTHGQQGPQSPHRRGPG